VWFPGGIVIGGLAAFFLGQVEAGFWEGFPLACWQTKLALVFVPTLIYGVLFTGQSFPATERVQSGLSAGDMFKATFFRPLFLVLFFCMGITASLELGPGRWMETVMGKTMEITFSMENAGILILVFGSTLMAVLRFFAGPVVHKLSPTGLLVLSVILSGLGLFMLSYASGPIAIIASATVFYVGVCYFWPTMLGVTSERVPKGGALALGLMGGWGMAVVGIITVPVMGWIIDVYGHEKIPFQEAKTCIQQAAELLPQVLESEGEKADRAIEPAIELVNEVNTSIEEKGLLPEVQTAKALRSISKYAADSEAGGKAEELVKRADEYGAPFSFRWVACSAAVLILLFGGMYLRDRAKGGYQAEKI